MAGKRRVAFFLEDAAQEAIIPEIFLRVTEKEGFSPLQFDCRILNAKGGSSIPSFRGFLNDAAKQSNLKADLLIVGSDANCKGFAERRETIFAVAAKSPHFSQIFHEIVTAIPDPHIERWYLLDLRAITKASGVSLNVSTPAYKCDKNHYKTLLRHAFRGTDVTPPLGGIEYGPIIAKSMNLYNAAKADPGLADYVDSTRAWLKRQRGNA
jgi:hypothetical protein